MNVTDEMVAAAYNRFLAAINDCEPCQCCAGNGHVHVDHDPDWCEVCGGSGFINKYDEQSAMKAALEAAILSSAQSGDQQ